MNPDRKIASEFFRLAEKNWSPENFEILIKLFKEEYPELREEAPNKS